MNAMELILCVVGIWNWICGLGYISFLKSEKIVNLGGETWLLGISSAKTMTYQLYMMIYLDHGSENFLLIC